MIECEETVEVVKTTRKTLRLSEPQGVDILRRWAEREHDMYQADIEFCVTGYDEQVEGILITTVQTEKSDG